MPLGRFLLFDVLGAAVWVPAPGMAATIVGHALAWERKLMMSNR